MSILLASGIAALTILVIVAAVVYMVVYLWLRHMANKEEHHNPVDAIDQPTTRGNLYSGWLGLDDYLRYKRSKKKDD